jgi:hypothetical protein
MANDNAKGAVEAYPSSCHAALTFMNNFKPFVIKGAALVAIKGVAFAKKQKQKVTKTLATECNYNKEYCTNKECHNCGKQGILQDVVPARKARQRRTLKMTNLCQVQS